MTDRGCNLKYPSPLEIHRTSYSVLAPDEAWAPGSLLVTRLSLEKAWKILTTWMDGKSVWLALKGNRAFAKMPQPYSPLGPLFGGSPILESYSATLDSARRPFKIPPYAVIVFMAEARRYLPHPPGLFNCVGLILRI
ncbi:hypothetical protein ACJ72_01831 [Emergomyces africanus]|uniref:Uncharacterized protein n=1 Tax=Emergomyces africanus TaxID=1955775 RepID=A0A1B7P462_9EURO|nr:hypothetical protein ACJ72_01831 [Emergomyces africanus]